VQGFPLWRCEDYCRKIFDTCVREPGSSPSRLLRERYPYMVLREETQEHRQPIHRIALPDPGFQRSRMLSPSLDTETDRTLVPDRSPQRRRGEAPIGSIQVRRTDHSDVERHSAPRCSGQSPLSHGSTPAEMTARLRRNRLCFRSPYHARTISPRGCSDPSSVRSGRATYGKTHSPAGLRHRWNKDMPPHVSTRHGAGI